MKKKIALFLVMCMAVGMLAACSGSDADIEETEEIEENVPVTIEIGMKTENKDEVTELSDNWADQTISIDGHVMSLPIDYDLLLETGWRLELMDYGVEEYYMNPGDLSRSLYLLNEDYPDYRVTCGVQFANSTDEVFAIKDCDIISIYFDICGYTGTIPDEYPEIELAGGIKWGSTAEEIIAAYGEPDTYSEADNGYTYMDYSTETDDEGGYVTMTMILYTDLGLTRVSYDQLFSGNLLD